MAKAKKQLQIKIARLKHGAKTIQILFYTVLQGGDKQQKQNMALAVNKQ